MEYERAEEMKDSWKGFLPLIGISILVYLLYRIGPGRILDALLTVRPGFLFLAIILYLPFLIMQPLKWGYLLSKQGIKIRFRDLFRYNVISWAYGMLTPAKLGSLIRIYYLRDHTKKPLATCATSVIIDRMLDLLSVTILAFIGATFLSSFFIGLQYSIAAFMLVFFAGIVLFFQPRWNRHILRVVYRFVVPKRMKGLAAKSFNELFENLPGFRSIFVTFVLSILTWVLLYSQLFVLAHAFSISVPYLQFITIAPVTTIVGLIPVTIGGIGTREATYAVLFSVFGIQAALMVSFSLTSHMLALVVAVALLVRYGFRKPAELP